MWWRQNWIPCDVTSFLSIFHSNNSRCYNIEASNTNNTPRYLCVFLIINQIFAESKFSIKCLIDSEWHSEDCGRGRMKFFRTNLTYCSFMNERVVHELYSFSQKSRECGRFLFVCLMLCLKILYVLQSWTIFSTCKL